MIFKPYSPIRYYCLGIISCMFLVGVILFTSSLLAVIVFYVFYTVFYRGYYRKVRYQFIPKKIEGYTFKSINMLYSPVEFQEAISNFLYEVEQNPDDADAHLNLAKTLTNAWCLRKAEGVCNKGILLAPADYRFFEVLGQIYERSGDFDLAETTYNKALELNPQSESKDLLKSLRRRISFNIKRLGV